MISVVISTRDSERLLVHTLAALVPGALAGVVREVIVADSGSQDDTARVADVAGCHFLTLEGSRGARLMAAAETARADWLWFLQPGSIPDRVWIEEVERFIRDSERDGGEAKAAVLRRHARGVGIGEAIALAMAALGARPKPQQGLLIAKPLYRELGGHDAASDDPETALLRKLGRKRIAILGAAMTLPTP
jgi:hypothetical protein